MEGRDEGEDARVGDVPRLSDFLMRVLLLGFLISMSVAEIYLHRLDITSNLISKRATPLDQKV